MSLFSFHFTSTCSARPWCFDSSFHVGTETNEEEDVSSFKDPNEASLRPMPFKD